ncbi:hypothetical protein D3C85_1023220 [compost metagenome]
MITAVKPASTPKGLRILCAFDTHRNRDLHVSTMVYVPSAVYDHKNSRLIAGDVHIYYRVISDMRDVLQIAGCVFHVVEWHYTPADDVRNWVMSRVRGVL